MGEGPKQTPARQRILDATAELFAESTDGEVSTRAICERADVSAPTLYHHFGDKYGLLDAVVAHGFEQYLETKRGTESSGNALVDLANGWDVHVQFGLDHPAFYTLMYGHPQRRTPPAAAQEARSRLIDLLQSAVDQGAIRSPADRAADIVLAANTGVTLALIARSSSEIDLSISTQLRDAVIASLTVGT